MLAHIITILDIQVILLGVVYLFISGIHLFGNPKENSQKTLDKVFDVFLIVFSVDIVLTILWAVTS